MEFLVSHRAMRAALIAGLVATAWGPASFACSGEPILASMCIMAVPTTYGPFNNTYVLAAGQSMSINNYTALYSLIGVTYGGNATTSFNLPDLRGRFVIGADGANYKTGGVGGNNAVTLLASNLPSHVVPLGTASLDLSKLTVNTTLPTLTGTVALASAVATGTVSELQVNVVNGGGGTGTPSGNYLGKSPNAFGNLYSAAAPDATLNANAISGGKVSVTVPASTAPVTLPGSTVAGVVGGTATVSGNATYVGASLPVDNRPAYIALTYYIAASNALYPSRD
jgi:microcystin-dependent protein